MRGRVVAPLLCAAACSACSSFVMENTYVVSGRTLDLTPDDFPTGIGVTVAPRGSDGALGAPVRFGHVGVVFLPNSSAPTADDWHARIAALNEVGLACDEQHLNSSAYPPPSGNASEDLSIHRFCEWAAGNFASVADVKAALAGVRVVADPVSGDADHHYVVRDASGAGLIVEATDGRLAARDDLNDGGATGFGVVTNSPPIDEQIARARAILDEGSAPAPGGWTSTERFQRLALVKRAVPAPPDAAGAIAQAFAVLDTVDTPEGAQRGQDWVGEFTVAAFVRDHRNPAMYWRTARNQQVQRLRLADLDLAEGAERAFVSIASPSLPWFSDAAASLRPSAPDVPPPESDPYARADVSDVISYAVGGAAARVDAPLFKQCNATWADDLMDDKTVCEVGCLMSSVSMALRGRAIVVDGAGADPGTLNAWLRANGGYDGSNDLIESVVPRIAPDGVVVWPDDGMHTTRDLSVEDLRAYLDAGRVVILNVDAGHHFVLLVGVDDDGDTLLVNDPGFTRSAYSYLADVVGFRIFDMQPQA